jgi:hypothetical protein
MESLLVEIWIESGAGSDRSRNWARLDRKVGQKRVLLKHHTSLEFTILAKKIPNSEGKYEIKTKRK